MEDMRITENTSMDARTVSNNTPKIESVVKQGSEATDKIAISTVEQVQPLDKSDETKAKVQDAVDKMNEMLVVNNSASRFMYHEGLERYYVTVVDSKTEEVVKEIPPKKLLDAFYEMQKMLGMIVDEKI